MNYLAEHVQGSEVTDLAMCIFRLGQYCMALLSGGDFIILVIWQLSLDRQ